MAPPLAAPAGLDADAAARDEPQLAVGDDRFARLEPLSMTVSLPARARDRDGPQLHRLIRLDDEDVLTLLAGLHRVGRHDDRASDRSSASPRR